MPRELELALREGYQRIVCESNSKKVTSCIAGVQNLDFLMFPILQDIMNMIDFFVPCKMQCIRDVNIVADMLVKFCLVNEVHAFDVWDITSHVLEQVAKGVLN